MPVRVLLDGAAVTVTTKVVVLVTLSLSVYVTVTVLVPTVNVPLKEYSCSDSVFSPPPVYCAFTVKFALRLLSGVVG